MLDTGRAHVRVWLRAAAFAAAALAMLRFVVYVAWYSTQLSKAGCSASSASKNLSSSSTARSNHYTAVD